jgi:acyl-CoA synthetase (AMP-forming)/AMP-acid ligase II
VAEQRIGGELLIGDILRRAAQTVPQSPAATVGAETLSYGELERDANRLAHALRTRLGIGHGDRVAGWSDTSIEVLLLFVALAKLGAIFAPLNARLGAAEAGEVAALARAKLLIADTAHASGADEVTRLGGIARWALLPVGEAGRAAAEREAGDDPDRLVLDASALPDPDASIEERALREVDPHVIFFTSGSTGRPKGVVLSHRANWLRAFQGVFLDEPERTVCAFPLFHMAAFTLAMAAWQTRGEITYTASSAEAILEAVERRRATRLYGLPLLWKRIVESDTTRFDLSSLKQLDTGTSATPIELIREMKACFPKACVRIFYGSTEVGSATSLMDVDILRKPGSVGIASNNVDVRLAPDGEIEVRSPYLMDGYFDDPEATAAVLKDGWFAMGDMGAQDDEGYYSIVGRKKEILRTGGENVSPSEVEGVLRDFGGVEDIAIVGLPDASWGDVLCAAVVAAPGAEITLADLQAHCEGRIAGFKKPRRLALLDALPRTAATNQVQRTLLVEKIMAEGLASE